MAKFFQPLGPEPCGLTFYGIIANQNENLGIVKVDYQINSKQSIFGRYFIAHSEIPSSYTGTQLSVLNAGTDDEVNSVVLGHTYILNAGMLNTFRATLNRVGITKFQVPIFSAPDIGVAPYYQPLPDYSNINITGNFTSAGGFATPGLIATTTYQVSDDFNWVKGVHQLQFGVNLSPARPELDILRLLRRSFHFRRANHRIRNGRLYGRRAGFLHRRECQS